jgi:hypothetical protein
LDRQWRREIGDPARRKRSIFRVHVADQRHEPRTHLRHCQGNLPDPRRDVPHVRLHLLLPELKRRQSRSRGHCRSFGGSDEGSERFVRPDGSPTTSTFVMSMPVASSVSIVEHHGRPGLSVRLHFAVRACAPSIFSMAALGF